jgi:hypothetical protein
VRVVDRVRPLLRWRYAIVATVAVAFAVATPSPRTGIDWGYFVHGSELLFGQHRIPAATEPGGLHLYANYPVLQIGPLSFLAVIPLRVFGEDASRIAAVVLLTAAGIAFIWLLERIAKHLHGTSGRAISLIELTTLVGGSAVAAGWYSVSSQYMHVDDVLVLGFGCLALWATAHGRATWLGVAIGLAVAAKPTGLILLPLAFRFPRSDWWRPLLITGVCALVSYLPFVIADSGTLSAFRPRVSTTSGSVLRVFDVHDFSWVRPAQLIGAFVAGTVAIWRGRWPAVVLVGVAVRMALDPAGFEYYASSLMLGAFAWDILRSDKRLPIFTVAVFWFLVTLGIDDIGMTARGLLRLAITGGVVAAVCLPSRRAPVGVRA